MHRDRRTSGSVTTCRLPATATSRGPVSATRCRRWAGESRSCTLASRHGQDARIAVASQADALRQADELRVQSHVRRGRHGERQRRDGSARGRGFQKGTVVFLDLERTRRFPKRCATTIARGWRACWPTASTSPASIRRAQCAADLHRRGGRLQSGRRHVDGRASGLPAARAST